MRIQELSLQGIGPFIDHYSIDFTKFDTSGLFLLEGPTGAGKSTIIDAIVFALYGAVSSNDKQAEQRLRSTYCSADQKSFVSLQFETKSGQYLINRTPSYFVPGRKNIRPASAKLSRITHDDEGQIIEVEPISAKVKDTNLAVAQLIGLDLNQFLQTVVLPQGKFATFLMAGSDERQRILQEIFGTGIYREFQQILQQKSRDARQGSLTGQTRVHTQLDSLISALDSLNLDNETWEELKCSSLLNTDINDVQALWESDFAVSFEILETFIATQTQDLRSAMDLADISYTAAQANLLKEEKLQQYRQQYEQINKRLKDLQENENEIRALKERIDKGITAQSPYQQLQKYQIASEELEVARQALEVSQHALVTFLEDDLAVQFVGDFWVEMKNSPIEDTIKRFELETVKAISSKLDQLQGKIEVGSATAIRLKELSGEYADSEMKISKLHKKNETLNERNRQLGIAKAETEKKLLQLDVTEENLRQIGTLIEENNSQIEICNEISVLSEQINSYETALTEAIEKAAEAGNLEHVTRRKWLSSAAAIVAAELQDNVPCPVCGSPEHPLPADVDVDAVTVDQVEIASENRKQADDEVRRCQEQLLPIVTRRGSLEKHVVSTLDILLVNKEKYRGHLNLLNEQLRKKFDLEKYLLNVLDEEKEKQQSIHSTEIAITSEISFQKQISSEMNRLEDEISSLSYPYQSIEEKQECATIVRSHLDVLERSLRTLNLASLSVEETNEELKLSLENSGYMVNEIGIQLLQDDYLPQKDLQDYQKTVTSYKTQLERLKEQLSELEEQALNSEINIAQLQQYVDPEEVEIELEKLRISVDSLALGFKNTAAIYSAHNAKISLFHDQSHNFLQAVEELKQQFKEDAPLHRLSAIANASGPQNLNKTPLASYVLMRRFDEVLAAANPRLADFSNQHYQLVRRNDGKDGNRKTGLGLEIFDNETELRRSPQTLSGGESFYTSLALALGLAEVVTAEAGGFDLGTIFIDEGFGSLDSETLDIVMKHLEELRSGGRSVGVISHVSEMQSRITDGVKIRRKADGAGSTLLMRA